jgi:hypothetical protein
LEDIKHKLNAPNEVIDVFASYGTGVSAEELTGSLSGFMRLTKEMKAAVTEVLRSHQGMVNDSGAERTDGH